MIFTLRLPNYFHVHLRREMRQLYIASGIADLALAASLVFEPIFLYAQLGFTLTQVLLFYGVVYAFYVCFIPLGAKVAARLSYKRAMILSVPFQLLYWLTLAGSQYWLPVLFFTPLFFAVQKALFWPAYHATIVRYAHRQSVGREFSGLQALVNIAQIAGPLIGGFLASQVGAGYAFVMAAGCYALMVVPLSWHASWHGLEPYRYRDTWKLYKQYPKQALGYMGFAEEFLALTVWPIFIFTQVSGYAATGMLVTVASLIAAYLNLLVGRMADSWDRTKMVLWTSLVYAGVWVARIFTRGGFAVLGADTAGRWSKDATFVSVSSMTYQRAENHKNLPYLVFFEQSLALGKLLASLAGVLLLSYFGADAFWPLFAIGALATLLYTLL